MDDRIQQADNSLARYYALHNVLYCGQFKKWVNENGFDLNSIQEEFQVDPQDSCLVDVDENFPGDLEPEHIVVILSKCWNDPNAFIYNVPVLKVTSEHWNVDEQQKKDIIAIYEAQCGTIFSCGMKSHQSFIKLLAVSRNLNEPYFQFVCDMYQRDRISSDQSLQPSDWALKNKHCMELKAMKSECSKPLTETVSAVTSMYRSVMPKLMLNSQTEIVDSLEETAKYIAVFVDFVCNLAEENNEYYNLLIDGYCRCMIEEIYNIHIINDIKYIVSIFYAPNIGDIGYCPFQVDVCFAFNEVRDCSVMALQGFHIDDEDEDEDEDDDEDDDEKCFGVEFYDCFGNIKKRLSAEKLLNTITVIDDQHNGDNTEISEKLLIDAFKHFKNTQIAKKYKEENVFSTYPQKHRFCILIDRRKPDKKDIDSKGTVEQDECIFFEPPNDCNTFPNNEHVPFWYFNSSQTCIIPNIGYQHGKHLNDIDNLSYLSRMDARKRILNEAITARSPCKGSLLVLSFHVESVKETRIHLYLNGQTARFLAEDIISVLPRFFDETYGNNKDFPQSEKAQALVDRMMTKLKDDKFDAFYREYGNLYQYKYER